MTEKSDTKIWEIKQNIIATYCRIFNKCNGCRGSGIYKHLLYGKKTCPRCGGKG